MQYISGMHALNIPSNINTTGDWHRECYDWRPEHLDAQLRNSDDPVFKDYRIIKNKDLNFIDGDPIYNVADHIRACLDLIEEGSYGLARGMRNDYICTDEYDEEIFKEVLKLKDSDRWNEIDDFMSNEYKLKWIKWRGNEK